MRRAYRVLLRLYPFDYRAAFAVEMQAAFDRLPDARVPAELIALLRGAAGEWIAKFATDRAVRGRALPDVRMMRPVGVPKAAWFRKCS